MAFTPKPENFESYKWIKWDKIQTLNYQKGEKGQKLESSNPNPQLNPHIRTNGD